MMAMKLIALLCMLMVAIDGYYHDGERVLLDDVQTLTFRRGQMTKARRVSPIPQMECTGGPCGDANEPNSMQCYNRGSNGIDVQWECKASTNDGLRLGSTQVSCEGYDDPNDRYVLAGSCGVEYTLERTHSGGGRGGSYPRGQYHHRNYSSSSDGTLGRLANVVVFVVVVGIFVLLAKSLLSNSGRGGASSSSTHYGGGGGGPAGGGPGGGPGLGSPYGPGPGLKAPRAGGASSSSSWGPTAYASSAGRYGAPPRAAYGAAPGFWTGMGTGGVLGYLFGRNGTGYRRGYGMRGGGGRSYSSSRSSAFSYGGGGGGGGRSSTSTSFAGTRRR